MTDWRERFYAHFYLNRPGYSEGTVEFHNLCAAECAAGSSILEIGAGPSNRTSRFLSMLGKLYGIDPDPAVLTNDALASASIMEQDSFPVPDSSFDCCVSDYVVEHVGNGSDHLLEVARVLKPGGAYVFRTVNRLHYVALIASITPHSFHTRVANRARALPKEAHDPYPTRYAMNTESAIRKAAKRANLKVERVIHVEKEPAYGRFSRVAFLLLTAYERMVNSAAFFAPLRANLFVVLRKPSE